jgi:hypothetical protein
VTLPEIRKTVMRPTFRAPVSRPGADTRMECWQAMTTDGVWVMDRIEDDHYCKWALSVQGWNVELTRCHSLRSCRELIALGGSAVWTAEDRYVPWESLQADFTPTAWAIRWKGNDVQRAEFDDSAEAQAWAADKAAA